MNDIVTTAPHDGTLVRTNGWNLVRLRGEPAVLGYDHGWLLANEIAEALAVGDFMARQDTGGAARAGSRSTPRSSSRSTSSTAGSPVI
jgi:hypothetical protein